MIDRLIESKDPHRAYFALTLVARELVRCQKLLAPHSPFFHVVKDRLAADMRWVLIKQLVADN